MIQRWLVTLLCVAAGLSGEEELVILKEDCGETACLTLQKCYLIALDRNPSVRAAAEGIAVAEETVGVARAPYYPEARFHSSYNRRFVRIFLPTGGPLLDQIPQTVGPYNDYNINFSSRYRLYDSGERRAQLLSAISQQGIAEAESDRIEQEILMNVAVAYHSLNADMDLVETAKKVLARSENHLKIVQNRYETGSVPKADILRAKVDRGDAEQDLIAAESMLRISQGNLNTAMGLNPESCIELCLEKFPVVAPDQIDLCLALDRALEARPEIASISSNICSLQYEIERAKSQFGPKFYAEGAYGWRDTEFYPKQHEWNMGVGFDIPLFTGFELEHNLKRTYHELSQAWANYEKIKLDIRNEVWTAYAKLKEAYQLLATTETQIEYADESLRLTTERYEVGASTINDLIDAQTALAQAENQRIQAVWSYQTALTQLIKAQGLLKP